MNIPKSFIWTIICFKGPFEYGDGGIFKLLRWMQNLHESTWDHTILCADRSLKDEQLLITSLLQDSKNMNVASCSNLKIIFYFMETTHELLHLVKWSFLLLKIMNMPTSFIWIIILFEYGGISKCWGYVTSTNAELLCVEFCNFVQCLIVVNYLSCYCFIKGVLNIRNINTAFEKYSSLYRPIIGLCLECITWGKKGSEFNPWTPLVLNWNSPQSQIRIADDDDDDKAIYTAARSLLSCHIDYGLIVTCHWLCVSFEVISPDTVYRPTRKG
jgi:hypothetical protein